jgi:hypothetical protein
MSTTIQGERSIGELMGDLARESSDLIQNEIKLARLETTEKIAELKTGIASFAVGGVIAFAGMLILLQAAALALDLVLQKPWLSFAVVGGATLVVGLIAVMVGRSRVSSEALIPERTAASLRKDQRTVARHVGAS